MTMKNLPLYYDLIPAARYYDWGNPDGLLQSVLRKSGIEPGPEPHAELWYGAHSQAPSAIIAPDSGTKENLNQAIDRLPGHFLGNRLTSSGIRQLPFLLKLLDAARPLSIQAHPDAEQAKVLHEKSPEHYPDDNHKPELAVAIGNSFEAMAGFRPVRNIADHFQRLTAFARLVEAEMPVSENLTDGSDTAKKWLKNLYDKLNRARPDAVRSAVEITLEQTEDSKLIEDLWFRRLTELYGRSDPGVFAIYLLNHLQFKHGEGLFMGAREPHAYLKGSILECMASSDNVVRGGLTSKFRDVDTLVSMLHYETGRPSLVEPSPASTGSLVYQTPVKDFAVHCIADRYHSPQRVKIPSGRPVICCVIDGAVDLVFEQIDKKKTGEVNVPAGSAVFLPGDLSEKNITVYAIPQGNCEAYMATTLL